MIEIGSKPVLWHIMKVYSVHGVNDFVICCGYKGYIIKEYFANYFMHMSDITFDMADNSVVVHQKKAETLADLIKAARPEIVFHLAAQPLVCTSYREPRETFATNVMGTTHVLDALRGLDSARVWFCGTSWSTSRILTNS
jgi:nucleoside-diphosphate-sugar epimerase